MATCDYERQNISEDSLNERLRNAGLKLTQPRSQVLKLLLDNPRPLSADELFKISSEASIGMDLVTIYRTLKKFEDSRLVTRLEFGDGVARFELTLESGHHHHHVICRKCQKIEVLHKCELDQHVRLVESLGYAQVTHRLDFFGVCVDCQ